MTSAQPLSLISFGITPVPSESTTKTRSITVWSHPCTWFKILATSSSFRYDEITSHAIIFVAPHRRSVRLVPFPLDLSGGCTGERDKCRRILVPLGLHRLRRRP